MPLGPWELGIILVIIVIIFGVGRLPEIGGALGKGIKEFRTSAKNESQEDDDGTVVTTTTTEVKGDAPKATPVKEEL
jgi:sec-independent protein translocase protein TatA